MFEASSVLKVFKTTSVLEICKIFAGYEILDRYEHLKEIPLNIIGAYRDVIWQTLNPVRATLKTIRGKRRVNKFTNAQTFKALQSALSVDEEDEIERRMLSVMRRREAEPVSESEQDVDGETEEQTVIHAVEIKLKVSPCFCLRIFFFLVFVRSLFPGNFLHLPAHLGAT